MTLGFVWFHRCDLRAKFHVRIRIQVRYKYDLAALGGRSCQFGPACMTPHPHPISKSRKGLDTKKGPWRSDLLSGSASPTLTVPRDWTVDAGRHRRSAAHPLGASESRRNGDGGSASQAVVVARQTRCRVIPLPPDGRSGPGRARRTAITRSSRPRATAQGRDGRGRGGARGGRRPSQARQRHRRRCEGPGSVPRKPRDFMPR